MKLKPNRTALRLRRIPVNTVVHTPTEAEAKELLALLHENGWRWQSNKALNNWQFAAQAYRLSGSRVAIMGFTMPALALYAAGHIITLTEFKRLYCEEEKSQTKYHLGERVRIVLSGEEDFINMITDDDCYELLEHRGKYVESELEPYTEPETKPTKDMETKELNLCDLLADHIGEMFYSPIYGDIELCEIKDADHTLFPLITEGADFMQDGRVENYQYGRPMLYPSRALYEQYPLDAAKAWSVWANARKPKYYIEVHYGVVNGIDEYLNEVLFRTTDKRDECIKEIKNVITKHINAEG